MRGMLGWLLVASPFIFGGGILIADFLYIRIGKWRERRAIAKRNARQVRFGMAPFRGTKEYRYDDQH
jgi:hypothetical protein